MKTKKTLILIALLLALSISAHAGGLIEMAANAFIGGGRDRGLATNGKVTVRGLARYNGKFVMGLADSDPALLAAGNISSAGVVSAAAISGGKASLKVWRIDGDTLGGFDGNIAETLVLSIYDGDVPANADAIAMGLVEVNFKKGSGSGTGAFIGGGAFGGAIDRGLDRVFDDAIASASSSAASSSDDSVLDSIIAIANAVGGADAPTSAAGGGILSRVGGFFGSLFGGGKDDTAETPPPAASGGDASGGGGSSGGLLGGLFGGGQQASGGSSGGGWTEVRLRDFEMPNGTWVATYAMSVSDGIDMSILHTLVIRGGKATSNVAKQTLSGPNVNSLWPYFKMAYESGLAPGSHRVNDAQRTIETTYDPDDPIFSGAAYENTDSTDSSVRVFINAAKNRVRIDLDNDILPEILYVKR